jgi:hypothetical protein
MVSTVESVLHVLCRALCLSTGKGMGCFPLFVLKSIESRCELMLKLYFVFVLAAMIGVTTWASLEANVFEGFHYLFADRWGIATLMDTYFSFITIYLWIAFKEKSILSKAVWLVLVCGFGSIAFSIYILREIHRTRNFEMFLIQRN